MERDASVRHSKIPHIRSSQAAGTSMELVRSVSLQPKWTYDPVSREWKALEGLHQTK